MLNVGEFPWSWGRTKLSKEKEKFVVAFSIASGTRGFHVVVVQWRQINVSESMLYV